MRKVLPVLSVVLLMVLVAAAAAEPGRELVITQPGAGESSFAELRDFYVFGIFPGRLDNPGDIRIELFRGDPATGERVRLIESHVDPATGVTPWSAIETNYSEGSDWGNRMVPDLVKEPGGLFDPSNKLVVTSDYYLGMVLGGATKDFDTTYRDNAGRPLADLTAGNYTIRVTGLSGNLNGQVAEKAISFGLTSSALSTNRPPVNLENRVRYAKDHNLRVYLDYFPGYFLFSGYGDKGYAVPKRWNPNNGIEVVNDLPGTTTDNPASAVNTLILYNINDRSTTMGVELSAILRYGLEDNPNTTFLYYDTGEPYLAYFDTGRGQQANITGRLVPFSGSDRLVLTRAEIYSPAEYAGENLFDTTATAIPRQVDFDLSDGIAVPAGGGFVLYGVTKPIAASPVPAAVPYRFVPDNQIATVTYDVTGEGETVYRSEREVNLSRFFSPGSTERFNSQFEFGHAFHDLTRPGTYHVSLSAADRYRKPVAGTGRDFVVTVLPASPEQVCMSRDLWGLAQSRLALEGQAGYGWDLVPGAFPQ